jgi:hypothetical protein
MNTDDIKALLALSLLFVIFCVIGSVSIVRPQKVRKVLFIMMDFIYGNGTGIFYKKRKAMMSKEWFLIYLRITGAIALSFAILFLFLIFYKINHLTDINSRP